MNSDDDEDQLLPTSTADAAQRPWQFSLRGLMGLMFVSSILFTLISWWGYEGLQMFVLALAIILAALGLFRRRFQYLACSGLCCSQKWST